MVDLVTYCGSPFLTYRKLEYHCKTCGVVSTISPRWAELRDVETGETLEEMEAWWCPCCRYFRVTPKGGDPNITSDGPVS